MLIECVRKTIETYAMVGTGDRVLVAVSGGADSVCLLDVLRGLGYELEVAHFDHETRSGESHGDAAFVGDLAERWSLPCHCERRPVRAESEASPYSFEEYARKVRDGILDQPHLLHQVRAVHEGRIRECRSDPLVFADTQKSRV